MTGSDRSAFDAGKTWVVKVGSSLLTNDGQGIDRSLVQGWVDEIASLQAKGYRLVLVSSGAVAEGMMRLGLTERPRSLHELQAAAAVGQMGLVQMYETAFKAHDVQTAQVLLTHDDLRSRQRYLNAKSTLQQLLDLHVVPIINENDTVVTDEIQFGDNDTLASLVANLIEASTLLLLTDQQGLLAENPQVNPNAELISRRSANDPTLDMMAGGSGSLGRGGMQTKVSAARVAARSGANTVIASGRAQNVISDLATGKVVGTLLTAETAPIVARKQWLANLPVKGRLILDDGACRVLKQDGRSLLSVGVAAVEGIFSRGDMVACVDAVGSEIARGLVNYSHLEVTQIQGKTSEEIESSIGYLAEPELIHRDNLILT